VATDFDVEVLGVSIAAGTQAVTVKYAVIVTSDRYSGPLGHGETEIPGTEELGKAVKEMLTQAKKAVLYNIGLEDNKTGDGDDLRPLPLREEPL